MEKRNYPIERKLAPTWQCPVCDKVMSSRGRSGHLEKVHGRGKPLKEHDPFPKLPRALAQKRRPLSRNDVRNLIANITRIMIETTRTPNILEIRKGLFYCEYLIRELEINANCTIEEAWRAFPIERHEIEFYKRMDGNNTSNQSTKEETTTVENPDEK